MTTERKRVSWIVEIDGEICIVFAETNAKAKWIATRSYWDAFGRIKDKWPKVKARRAMGYDASYLAQKSTKAWTEEHVMETMK